MKSLLSLNSYHYKRGGSDVVYLDHANLFESKGWESTFFSMHHPSNLPTDDSRYFIDLVDFEYSNTRITKLKTALKTVYNFQAREKIRHLLNEKKFSIAHAHCIYHHLTPAIFKDINNAGIPIVLTAHDLKVACPAYKMMNYKGICEECKGGNFMNIIKNKCIKGSRMASSVIAFEAYLYKSLDIYGKYLSHIIAPSKFYKNKIIEWGFDSSRVSYIPNFTKPIAIDYRSDYDGNILYFGRLSEEKGLYTLIEASQQASIPVDIIGSGPIMQQLVDFAASISAPVNFLGRLDGDRLWHKIGCSKAIVIPSEWYENAPMSVLEAFQLERPVIGAEIGGIPELISPEGLLEECGWLFKAGDSKGLAIALQKVATTPKFILKEKGHAGRKLALNRFSVDSYYESVKKIYNNLRD